MFEKIRKSIRLIGALGVILCGITLSSTYCQALQVPEIKDCSGCLLMSPNQCEDKNFYCLFCESCKKINGENVQSNKLKFEEGKQICNVNGILDYYDSCPRMGSLAGHICSDQRTTVVQPLSNDQVLEICARTCNKYHAEKTGGWISDDACDNRNIACGCAWK